MIYIYQTLALPIPNSNRSSEAYLCFDFQNLVHTHYLLVQLLSSQHWNSIDVKKFTQNHSNSTQTTSYPRRQLTVIIMHLCHSQLDPDHVSAGNTLCWNWRFYYQQFYVNIAYSLTAEKKISNFKLILFLNGLKDSKFVWNHVNMPYEHKDMMLTVFNLFFNCSPGDVCKLLSLSLYFLRIPQKNWFIYNLNFNYKKIYIWIKCYVVFLKMK